LVKGQFHLAGLPVPPSATVPCPPDVAHGWDRATGYEIGHFYKAQNQRRRSYKKVNFNRPVVDRQETYGFAGYHDTVKL